MKRREVVLLLLVMGWLGDATLAQEKPIPEQVDSVIKTAMEKQRIPGLSLAVVKDGKMVLAKGYGLANVELNVAATPETVYEIGSVTKQFTATAVMMLVEEGKIGLDDKIIKYLTGLPEAWKEVTVRNLLTHTSGIKSYTALPDFARLTVTPASQERLVGVLGSSPLQFDPGTRWAYSNTGYYLLGRIVEKASGTSYGKFLQDRIFTPLDMQATQVNDLGRIIKNRAAGYSLREGTLKNGGYVDMSWPYAAGAIVSTVVDLAKWNLALDEKKLLKPSSFQEMWTPVKLSDGSTHGYGFGWLLEKGNGPRTVSHGGGIDGFKSLLVRYPDCGLAVIVLTNADWCTPEVISWQVASLYEPSLVPPKRQPLLPGDSSTSPKAPVGLFVCRGPGPTPEKEVDFPFIDGWLVRPGWDRVEPKEGEYDFTYLDGEIALAKRLNKKITLSVLGGPQAPAWLYAAGAKQFEYTMPMRKGSAMKMPVFWDEVYLKKWTALVQALGKKYNGNDTIVLVHMTGATGNGLEMQLPFMPQDREQWNRIAYTPKKVVAAWKQIIDAFIAAFPSKPLDIDIHPVLDSDQVAEDVAAYGSGKLGKRFGIFSGWLSGKTAEQDRHHAGMHAIAAKYGQKGFAAFQMISSQTPSLFNPAGSSRFAEGGLKAAVEQGMGWNARYFEIWQTDAMNPQLHPLLEELAARLKK